MLPIEQTLPEWIGYHAGALTVDSIPAEHLVERFGTPMVVYSKGRLRSNASQIQRAFKAADDRALIAFACKACYHRDVLGVFAEQRLHVEVMSPRELEHAEHAGFAGDTIIINGLGKTEPEIRRALVGGAFLINVDSVDDLEVVNRVAEQLGVRARVGIRVSPGLTDERFRQVPGKLGLDIDAGDAARVIAAAQAARAVDLEAIHVHAYSLQTTPELSEMVLARVSEFVTTMAREAGFRPRFVDVGGGFNSRYLIDRAGGSITDFAARIVPRVRALAGDPVTIIEPGTFLVNDAAITLTRVVAVKVNAGRRWLVVDAGINVLNPSVFSTYETIPLTRDAAPMDRFNVVDGLCSPAGIQADALLPRSIGKGDVLAIVNCGAYTISSARCWGYDPMQVVLLDDDGPRSILGRETAACVARMMHGAET